eukprot:12350880-Alexandrium_andersonii.AAC.1
MVKIDNQPGRCGSGEDGHAGPAESKQPLLQDGQVAHVGGSGSAGQDRHSVDDWAKADSPKERLRGAS